MDPCKVVMGGFKKKHLKSSQSNFGKLLLNICHSFHPKLKYSSEYGYLLSFGEPEQLQYLDMEGC